jgi:hypothetical protein
MMRPSRRFRALSPMSISSAPPERTFREKMRSAGGRSAAVHPARGLCTRLQPLLERLEELKVHVGSGAGPRLVSAHQRVQLGLDHLLQFPDSGQVGVLPFLCLPVKNLLAIQVNFESAIRAGGERNTHAWSKAVKEFVRQPRGGRVELSRHAVQDIHQHFPFAVGRHGSPPDVPGTT